MNLLRLEMSVIVRSSARLERAVAVGLHQAETTGQSHVGHPCHNPRHFYRVLLLQPHQLRLVCNTSPRRASFVRCLSSRSLSSWPPPVATETKSPDTEMIARRKRVNSHGSRNFRFQSIIIGNQPLTRQLFTCSLQPTGLRSIYPVDVKHYTSEASPSGSAAVQTTADAKPCIDPYVYVQDELQTLCTDIKRELHSVTSLQLSTAAQYHFDGAGKYFRPLVIMLIARACNAHNGQTDSRRMLLPTQKSVAMIAEMIHTASLVHDDVIDASDTRRGKDTLQRSLGQRKAILAGDYILSVSTRLLARINNEEVVRVLAQVLEDLVTGEFMQLGSKEEEGERFNHYLKKTFKKTASLIANSCKAVAILGDCTERVTDAAYEYGKNIGIAFQLVDDLLDYVSTESILGKPASADLRLGLATAPVLFAAQQFPEINPMIMRRFSQPGDVQLAIKLVAKSDGVAHTRYLAEQHGREAVRQIQQLDTSTERQMLIDITQRVINRLK